MSGFVGDFSRARGSSSRGVFLYVGIFFVLAGRRARKLTENAADLHGSARWADEEGVRDTGVLGTKHGVYVGGWLEGGHRLSYLRHKRARARSRVRANPERQRRGIGDSVASRLEGERRDL
jgi:hypothetical protein